jgi:ABC-type phosphate/phosphonate transport system substrate-binding protein
MGALQMKGVDAIAAFEYLETHRRQSQDRISHCIKAIARSKPIPNQYLYSRPSKSQAKQKQVGQLTEALLRFHEDPAAKPVLDYFGIEQFLAAP